MSWRGCCASRAGVITWRQAVDRLGPGKVQHLVTSGRWRRVCRGVMATVTGWRR